MDDADAVADLLHLGQEMARQEHGASGVGEVADDPPHGGDAVRVEAVRRLVEEIQCGILHERRGQPEALPHAERIARHLVTRALGEANALEGRIDLRRIRARIPRQDHEVVAAGQVRVEGGRLDHRPDAAQRLGRAGRRAEDRRAPVGGPDQSEDQAQERRLPGSVRADEPVHLARSQLEVDVVEREDVRAVAPREVPGLDDRAGAHRSHCAIRNRG